MKKHRLAVVILIIIVVISGLGYSQFKKTHTFTLSDLKSEEIQPVFGTVRVWGTQDTSVLFIDVENPEVQFEIGYITPGMSETIKLQRGRWYRVEAQGKITIQMINVRIE